MSSEDSRTTSSSRLSQFGIYRSIDARTEEFLRLSRKRQIRQGCACAAVSTAITVTIVITVLLIYEYTMNMDSNPAIKSRMSAWHGIFNDTSPFEFKYSKSKVNIDPTTLKLLPLVLKALNQNRHFEKLIENASSGPVSETRKDVNKEYGFKKTIFGSPLKSTHSIHKTDFITPHAVGYKNTFNNLDYYKKIRQANDHHRMLNYFEKMTNVNTFDLSASNSIKLTNKPLTERSIQSPAPFFSEKKKRMKIFNTTIKPYNSTTFNKPPKNLRNITKPTPKKQSKIISLPKSETTLNLGEIINPKYKTISLSRNQRLSHETSTIKSIKSCKCSNVLGDLLSKLITDIQNIIPQIEFHKMSCNDESKVLMTESTPTTTALPITSTKKMNILPKLTFGKKNICSTYKPKLLNKTKQEYYIEEISIQNETSDYTRLPNKFDFKPKIDNKTNIFITTTMKAYIEPTYTTPAFIGLNTKPMLKTKRKNIWNHKIGNFFKNIYSKSTRNTMKMPKIIEDLDNYDQPSKSNTQVDTSDESRGFFNAVANEDFLTHEHDNIYIFPLLGITRKSDSLNIDRGKQNTTSIIEWHNTLKKEKKDDYHFHSKGKGEHGKIHYKQETTTKATKMTTGFKGVKTIKIEPKINSNLNIINEMKKYNDHKNISRTRKIIYPIWPEEDKNYNRNSNETAMFIKGFNQVPKTLDASILPVINRLKINSTELDDNTDKTKRNSVIQKQNSIFINSHQTVSQQGTKSKIKDKKNKITTTSTIKPFPFNIETKTSTQVPMEKNKNIGLLESLTGMFSSRFAEINDLLFQTKNISNETIYEKFNFENYINHTDENNTFGTLEYDEFKFMNDEIQEKEVKLTETDKYEALKSAKYEKDSYSDDSTKFTKSMIPIGTYIPIFLEIQRNDFIHDNSDHDHDQDYENNN